MSGSRLSLKNRLYTVEEQLMLEFRDEPINEGTIERMRDRAVAIAGKAVTVHVTLPRDGWPALVWVHPQDMLHS